MALATKYRIEGTSDVYGKVTVNIQLDNYLGSIIDLDAVGRNWIELKIGDSSNDISNPILAGRLTVQFYVNTDFETTEIGRSEIYTYYVEVLDENSDQIWAGWALPEEYTEAYQNTPYVATLIASDGLDELKNVNYILQDGKASLFTHIQSCLIQTFVNNNIFESINIYSNGMDSDPEDSPLNQAQVTYNSFRSISESPKAYEVLASILTPFFARIYQYRGWRIENILEKRSSYVVREYDITGAYVGQTTFDPLVKFDTDYADFRAFIQKSGQLSIRPALNNAEVYFNTVEPVEPTTSQGFQNADDWVSTTELDKWTAVAGVGANPISIEQVPSAYQNNEFAVKIPGRKTTLEQTDYLESDAIAINTADYETINVEFAHYANYPAIVLLGSKPILYFEIVFTHTSTGDVYNWTGSEWVLIPLGQPRKRLRIDFNDRMKWRLYSVAIDRVPFDGTIQFRFYKLIKSGTEGVTELRLTAWKTNLISQQPTNASLLLEGATTNVFSTYKGPSFPHIISDGTVLNAAGVMDVASTLTSTWARRGVTESLNIRRLFLLQWLTFNSKPTEVLTGTIHQKGEVITPMSVIKDKDAVSSVRYVMQGYTLNLGTGFGSANYRELVTVDANINAFQEFLDSIRLGDFFPQTVNYNIFIGGAPGLSPNANPGQIDLNFSLNGDVRGGLNQAEITPASINNKARLDLTGLTDSDIVIGAVKNSPDQENMTNLRLSDVKSLIGHSPVTIASPANGLSITAGQVLSLGLASAGVTGALSGTDWSTFNGKIGGTIASGQVAFGTGAGVIGGDSGLTWDNTTRILKTGAIIIDPLNSGSFFEQTTLQLIDRGTSSGNIIPIDFLHGTTTRKVASIKVISQGSNSVGGALISFHTSLDNTGNTNERWRITNDGIFQSNGAQTIQSSTANLTIATGGGNGNILIIPNGTGLTLIGPSATPTNTIDVNGTARIRSIANGVGNFLTVSATGVVQQRTAAEVRGDISAEPSITVGTTLQYWRGDKTFQTLNTLAVPEFTNLYFTETRVRATVLTGYVVGTNTALTATDSLLTAFQNIQGQINARVPSSRILTINGVSFDLSADRTWTIGADTNKVSYNVADSKTASERIQARVNIGSTSATPQVIATAGAINDLAVASNHLVFTGASVVLSGIVAGLDGEEITILNASGTNLELLSQSALSVAANRFASGVIVPNLSIVRIKYRTTTARWVLENVGINDGRYVSKINNDDKTGNLRFLNASSLPIVRITPNGTEFASVFETVQIDGTVSLAFNRQGQIIQNSVAGGSSTTPVSLSHFSTLYFRCRNNLPESGEVNLISAEFSNRAVFLRSANSLQRSQGQNGFTRRDELYLNYSQTVATTGTINDLAINADCKLLILTGATDLTGVIPVDNTRLLRIEARGGNRIIRDQSTSSTDVNRFALGADLTINDGEVYQFIYTNSRWRRIL